MVAELLKKSTRDACQMWVALTAHIPRADPNQDGRSWVDQYMKASAAVIEPPWKDSRESLLLNL